MQHFPVIVYIGRFQPPHNGHIAIIRKALSMAHRVLVFIGSHEVSRSMRNPFTTEERLEMLRLSLADEENRLAFIPIHESNYDHAEWANRVRENVRSLTMPDDKIGIIGHKKDGTSYYLDLFPEWESVEMPLLENGISSTEIRNKWFGNVWLKDEHGLPPAVHGYLNSLHQKSWAGDLKEEYEAVEKYRKRWADSPYPPTFVAGDAVVICDKHVLLINRKRAPGKGLYAIPGGFLESGESIRHCTMRELIEETGIGLSYKELDKSIEGSEVFDDPLRDPRGRMISHAYLFRLPSPELPNLKAGDDASEATWFPLTDLDYLRDKFFDDHYKIIRNLLQ